MRMGIINAILIIVLGVAAISFMEYSVHVITQYEAIQQDYNERKGIK